MMKARIAAILLLVSQTLLGAPVKTPTFSAKGEYRSLSPEDFRIALKRLKEYREIKHPRFDVVAFALKDQGSNFGCRDCAREERADFYFEFSSGAVSVALDLDQEQKPRLLAHLKALGIPERSVEELVAGKIFGHLPFSRGSDGCFIAGLAGGCVSLRVYPSLDLIRVSVSSKDRGRYADYYDFYLPILSGGRRITDSYYRYEDTSVTAHFDRSERTLIVEKKLDGLVTRPRAVRISIMLDEKLENPVRSELEWIYRLTSNSTRAHVMNRASEYRRFAFWYLPASGFALEEVTLKGLQP